MFETEAEILVGIGMCLREPPGEKIEFGGSFGLGGAGLEARGYGDPVIIAPVEMAGVGEELIEVANRNPELRVENEIEPAEVWRCDADDGVRMAREGDRFAEDVGVGIETRFPDAVAKNDDGRVLLVRSKAAAQSESELRDVKEIGGSGLAPEALRIAVAGNGGGEEFVETGDAGERFGVVADIGVERPREVIAAFVAVGSVEGEESLRIADRGGVENEAADQGEDGGVGADAESESKESDGGEGGFAAKKARGETEIAEEGFEERKVVMIADGFFGLFQAAEFQEGDAAGFFGRHAGAEVVVEVKVQMGAEFIVQFPFKLGLVEEIAETEEEGAKKIHR